MAQLVALLLLSVLSMLPLFDATQCIRGRGYCPVGLDCNRNNSLCEYPQTCSVGANRTNYDQGFTCSSILPVCKPLQEDMAIIQNFHDPLVIGAACAAVSQITIKSVFTYKSVLVTITNGTRQVGNGVKFDLMIVVALSTTCKKDSELCTSVECPINNSTQQLWMVSIVAPPSLTTQTVKYDVLSIRQVMHIGSAIIKEIDEQDFFLCSICETIVAYLESYLDKKISRRAVKEMLNNACNNLTFQKSCLDFVNKYFDKIWNAVIHKTLGKLCCDFKFCTCENDDAAKGPMYPAASHGDLCPEGFFCLTGDDCSSNSSLCEVGVCQRPTEENCIQGITVQFSLNKYEVKENGEPAQLMLILSKPLEYCSSSILIKVENGTATGGVDYQFPRGGYTQVVVSGGADRVPFNITINNDNILERTENFRLSIVDASLPCGVIAGSRQSAEVVIFDDDRTCVKIDHQAYSIREGLILQVILSLNLRASYDIGVNVHGVDLNAKRYDYDPGPYRVTFRAGNTRASLKINITDDDIYEEAEAFNFYISTFLPSQVSRCEPYRSTVTILDDEQTIRVAFNPSTYTVEEDVGTFSPVLTLNRPSPCCITVFAELINSTAIGGGVDFDYPLPIMYEFTFLAGETCATPVDSIPITDDRISERDERFRITIIKLLLPLGVQTSRDSATINIQDNDIACSFERETYEIYKNDGPLKLRLRLDKTPPKEFNLQVHDLKNTANAGEDYTPGPYSVTFRKNSRISNEFSIPINKDGIYTGNKDFNLTIVDDWPWPWPCPLPWPCPRPCPLPWPCPRPCPWPWPWPCPRPWPFVLVPGDIISVNVTILNNKNYVSFQHDEYTVSEDERRVYLRINLDKPATNDWVIQVYTHLDAGATEGGDYDSGPYNVSFKKGDTYKYFYITIIDDDIFEGEEEFIVSLEQLPDGIVPYSPSTAIIKIVDDEYEVCFKSLDYNVVEGDSVELTLTLSRPLPTPLIVQLEYLSQSAKVNSDYYTPPRSVRFNAGSNETSFTIRTREDSIQEDKNEFFDVTATYTSKPNNTSCDIALVNIVDDDDITVSFDRGEYRGTKASPAKPRLKLNKAPTSSFTVIVEQRDGTAKGGDDYKLQRLSAKFGKGGSIYANLKPDTVFINDEIVEDDEFYYLDIVTETLPSRVTAVNPTTTKIIILDDDKSIVTREGNLLKFSKAIDFDTEVKVFYYHAPRTVTLTLKAGDKQVIIDISRPIQRITIYADSRLDRNDFTISTSRIYLTFSSS